MKAGAALAADGLVALFALVAIDAVYHLAPVLRGALLGVGLAALAALAALSLARVLRRKLADDDVALYVEGRYPLLKGSLISAVEYERRPREAGLQSDLVDALVLDCLERAAQVDFGRVVDRKRLKTRGIAAAVLLAFFLGAVAVRPGFFKHELSRVLVPWVPTPPSADELEAERRRLLAEDALRRAQQAGQPIPVNFTVTPGDQEIRRGGAVRVKASVNRLTGPLLLKFRSADGEWRTLQMEEDPAVPESYTQLLADISDDLSYQVAMKEDASSVFSVKVFDPAVAKELRLKYTFPAYTKWPEKTVTGMDGYIEGVEGTSVDVTLVASGPLRSGTLLLDNGQTVAMTARGDEISGTLTVKADGDYGIRAVDGHDLAVPFPARFGIRLIKDEPPKVEVVYPTLDAQVHAMEEVVLSAKAADTVGLKEVRVHTFYNSEPEQIQRITCADTTGPLLEKLAEFVIDLEPRPNVQPADTILFHFEAEDTKGQVSSTDMYTLTVRAYETFSAYGYHPVMPAHGYDGPAIINVIGAAWELHMKKQSMPPAKFKEESEKIGKALEGN